MQKGFFITFEGIDGSGKTTQIKLLDKFLAGSGYETVITREPGGTVLGDVIREILLKSRNMEISPLAETFLFQASRAELVSQVIRPSLFSGKIVICDRFFDSTIVYQGIARGLGTQKILEMSLVATGGLIPDITFLLSINSLVSNHRFEVQTKIPDRIENEEVQFKEKIQDGYLELAGAFKDRIIVIDGNQDIDVVFSQIKKSLEDFLQRRNTPKNKY